MLTPRQDLRPNTPDYETVPLVKPTGFREYDARWVLEKEINLLGIQALGLALATYVHEIGVRPRIVTGHDFRSYSLSVKQALILGLLEGGMEVLDVGLALSPMAYFGQFALDAPCVAMVTASHNENGWTGVKMGAQAPLTFGPDEMGRLKAIVLGGLGVARPGGRLERVENFRERYLYRSAVGFDRLANLLESAARTGDSSGWPPYNIETTGENAYRVEVAVAGFTPDELTVEVKESLLTVTGRKTANDEAQRTFLHRGLAERDFERRFQLADYVVVTSAKLENGLLSIALQRELPEALKPRRIEIATPAGLIEGQAA